MPKSAMGKEKETFQSWKKPRRKAEGGSTDNPSHVEASPEPPTERTNRPKNVKKARTMKKTVTREPSKVHVHEVGPQSLPMFEVDITIAHEVSGTLGKQKAVVASTRRQSSSFNDRVLETERQKEPLESRKGREGMFSLKFYILKWAVQGLLGFRSVL